MSVAEELVQVATDLNSALTEINTQLTAKGGTASSTVYGVADAVENLPSGETTSPNIIKAVTGILLPIQLTNGSWFLPNYDSYTLGKLKSSYNTDLTINPSLTNTQIRYVIKIKLTADTSQSYPRVLSTNNGSHSLPSICYNKSVKKFAAQVVQSDGQYVSCRGDYVVEINKWYYVAAYFRVPTLFCAVYDESGNWLTSNKTSISGIKNYTDFITLGGESSTAAKLDNAEIDLSETFVEVNGTIVWGKTNPKTQNMGIPTT